MDDEVFWNQGWIGSAYQGQSLEAAFKGPAVGLGDGFSDIVSEVGRVSDERLADAYIRILAYKQRRWHT